MKKEIEFHSEGVTLRGLLFLPESSEAKPPVVVMAHGTSATIHMVADKYAQRFYEAGLAVLLYDHKNLETVMENQGKRLILGYNAEDILTQLILLKGVMI